MREEKKVKIFRQKQNCERTDEGEKKNEKSLTDEEFRDRSGGTEM